MTLAVHSVLDAERNGPIPWGSMTRVLVQNSLTTSPANRRLIVPDRNAPELKSCTPIEAP